MPSFYQASSRHANHYLKVVDNANDLFIDAKTQAKGVENFDKSRGQIDIALNWICHQDPSEENDTLLIHFADVLMAIGMLRVSVTDTLIPLCERQIASAQRLGWKDMEACAIDRLGILHGYLGYKQQSIDCFERALQIAIRLNNNSLESDIRAHLRLARIQLERETSSITVPDRYRLGAIFRIAVLYLRFLIACVTEGSFNKVDILTDLASSYSIIRKYAFSSVCYKKALTTSHRISYRFGEIRALLGLIEVSMHLATPYKGVPENVIRSTNIARGLAEEIGVEWSTHLSVSGILLEIAPAIQNIERIANSLSADGDPRADEIYKMLERIIMRTSEVVTIVDGEAVHKHQQIVGSLQDVVDDLRSIKQVLE